MDHTLEFRHGHLTTLEFQRGQVSETLLETSLELLTTKVTMREGLPATTQVTLQETTRELIQVTSRVTTQEHTFEQV